MRQDDQWLKVAARRSAPFILIAALSAADILRAVYLSGFTGEPGPLWKVWIYELSSGAMLLTLMPFAAWTSGRFPLDRRFGRAIGAHLAASIVFSAVHVAGMVIMRRLVFASLSDRYDFGPSLAGFAYEYGKDLFTYFIFVAVFTAHFWAQRTLERRAEARRFRSRGGIPVPTTDGTVFIPFPALLRIEACGNYVTLVTAGGEFLHRATMREMEALLPPDDYARTHRSHIVRVAAIRAVRTDPTGEKMIKLDGGCRVPLSRTYANSRSWTVPLAKAETAMAPPAK